ncbi:TIGR01621 family pseudouridine synthase [Teredinibacter purpureus]|uniref:TIGR01621 family pseudouridine synthase n=1 Tax=Teredinibacter purpureus TaxID=2731756 RepID=UPI0005F7B1DA|nr:TIGR01621 family pseudouridine synthase [Teredinibacter purpureus]
MSTEIKVVAEQDTFIVVDKPIGLSVHGYPESVEGEGNLTSRIREQFNDQALFPCHRLDRVTSGLLLFAKGKQANSDLSQLFQNKQIQKTYVALSSKKPSKKQGMIKGDMKTSRGGDWILRRTMQNPAITQFFSYGLGNSKRLFVLKPHTGKTHQLRVAMKSLGTPIVGDERYGGEKADRCYLHAQHLSFSLNGQPYTFTSEPEFGAEFQTDECRAKLLSLMPFSALPWPKLKGCV